MTEQDIKQLMNGLMRSREQFSAQPRRAKPVKRMSERERDIRDAFRNR